MAGSYKFTASKIMNNIRLRAGIIGLGVGVKHIDGYQHDSRCKVVSICDINREKFKKI